MIIELCMEEGDQLKFMAMPKYGKDPVQVEIRYSEYSDELKISISDKKTIDWAAVRLSRLEE